MDTRTREPSRVSRRGLLWRTGAAAAGAAVSLVGLGAAVAHTHAAGAALDETPAGRFRSAMRRLWEDHIVWTRMFIVSAAAGLPDAGPAAQRLLRNHSDIGDALKPFYGDERFTGLARRADVAALPQWRRLARHAAFSAYRDCVALGLEREARAAVARIDRPSVGVG